MICGAFIEARSCERFAALAEVIGAPLSDLFRGPARCRSAPLSGLPGSRAARGEAGGASLDARVDEFAALEAQLITQPDPVFRFHSGPPR